MGFINEFPNVKNDKDILIQNKRNQIEVEIQIND